MLKKIILSMIVFSGFATASDKTIYLKKGDSYRIELPSNPTTGYKWELSKPLEIKSIVAIKKSGYVPKKTGLIGSGGTQFWNLRARKFGTIHLIFEYKRQWEKDTKPVDTKEFSIEII